MGDNSSDTMDISAGEETETEYFQDVANIDDNLDNSIDSLQGSLSIPIFSLERTTGLQGSQGFQMSNMHTGTQLNDTGVKMEPVQGVMTNTVFQNQTVPGHQSFNMINQPFLNNSQMTTFGVVNLAGVSSGSGNGGSAFLAQGNFNIMALPDNSGLTQGSRLTGGVSYMFGGDRLNPIVQDLGVNSGERKPATQEMGKSTSSTTEEKPGRSKSSPKGKGRKSGSTSSSVETVTKPDTTGSTVQTKTEPPDPGSLEQLQFKPSLLDEILTEKKLALMRSPEVIQFLQAQQETLIREKAMLSKHVGDS